MVYRNTTYGNARIYQSKMLLSNTTLSAMPYQQLLQRVLQPYTIGGNPPQSQTKSLDPVKKNRLKQDLVRQEVGSYWEANGLRYQEFY